MLSMDRVGHMVETDTSTRRERPIELQRPDPTLDWSLLSAQGRVLFYIALCPCCSVQEIAVALGLTERAVWGIIRLLRDSEMLCLEKDGRRHRYRVNLDAPLLHPTIQGLTLRPVLGEVAARGAGERDDNCVRIA